MAETIQRRTVTRTHEGASEMKENLAQVAVEIARVRDRAREEATSLEKIRGMLDLTHLNKLLTTIEELEVRMQTLEAESLGAAGDVDRANTELAREQERLAKLWDAFKAQEDELTRIKRDGPQTQERLAESQRQNETLRREVARLEPLGRFKSDYDQATRENQILRSEVENVNREARRVQDAARRLEDEARALREDAGSKGRVAELERALDEERARLAKLYKVYEEQEVRSKAANVRLQKWEQWFSKMEPAMSSFCRGVSEAPRA